MAGMGEVVRRLDYEKRARNTLGLRKSGSCPKIHECSPFVRSSNEYQLDRLKSAVRKMEASERQLRGEHDKRISSAKRFHNTVHVKSADLSDVAFNSNTHGAKNADIFSVDMSKDALSKRRGSFPPTNNSSSNHTEAKRRHSVQPDTSKYGRSFRMLKDAFKPKTKVAPESKSKGLCKTAVEGKVSTSSVLVSS